MIHIEAPTICVSRTVSSVSETRRLMIVPERRGVVVDRERIKRMTRSRVRTPSVNADMPIQRIATTCEGIPIGLPCSS